MVKTNIVKRVEEEANNYDGIIEKMAGQIYRLSAVIDDLLDMLVEHEILTEDQIDNYL